MPRAGRVSHATLVPLGQPEKAMGHESPIEPWLAPDNRAACGLRTDWLRRAETMKTAGKKNPKRCLHEAASRDHGTEGSNNPAQTRWAGRQEKIRPQESCFFLTPFIELTSTSVFSVRRWYDVHAILRTNSPGVRQTESAHHLLLNRQWLEVGSREDEDLRSLAYNTVENFDLHLLGCMCGTRCRWRS